MVEGKSVDKGVQNMSLHELNNLNICYKEIKKHWGGLIKYITEEQTEIALQRFSLRDLPSIKLTNNDTRLEFRFDPEIIFCQFRFINGIGIMKFGYIELDEYGKEKDIYTDKQLCFDTLGNIGIDQNSCHYSLHCSADLDKTFYAYLIEAYRQIGATNE